MRQSQALATQTAGETGAAASRYLARSPYMPD